MSKALRGDFERLRERGVATALAPRDDERRADVSDPPQAEPPAVETNDALATPVLRKAPDAPDVPAAPAAEASATDVGESKPGFFGRLLGR